MPIAGQTPHDELILMGIELLPAPVQVNAVTRWLGRYLDLDSFSCYALVLTCAQHGVIEIADGLVTPT